MTATGAIGGGTYKWEFKARFRRRAFGWQSQPAIQRVKQAVTEIKKVAKKDATLAGEGAVALIERLSPALEQVDGSSGAIGTAVNNSIDTLAPIVTAAPVDAKRREAWLERLYEAHAADLVPYIERLGEHWGDLCGSDELASAWADRLLEATKLSLSPDKSVRQHFRGTSACLSALFRARRFGELIELLNVDTLWDYKAWAARALAASGKKAEALRYAQTCRSRWVSEDEQIDAFCEEIRGFSSGSEEER
jgi:hypothetical protein